MVGGGEGDDLTGKNDDTVVVGVCFDGDEDEDDEVVEVVVEGVIREL